MNVDSYRFLPRSFRAFYEGRWSLPGELDEVWAPFEKRLQSSRIALLTSAGFYLKNSQPPFDLDRERANPTWGDPSWRVIPTGTEPSDLGVSHLHINDEDLLADPEIALPARMLEQLAAEHVIGGATTDHLVVMGYQEANLEGWRDATVNDLIANLRDQAADGLILAPA